MDISKSKGEEEEGIMGKIMVKAKMKNFVDEDLARRGLLKQEEVREEEKEGLIGQIPLEEMDLIVDPKTGNLIPRPESPDMHLIDVFEYSTWRGSRR